MTQDDAWTPYAHEATRRRLIRRRRIVAAATALILMGGYLALLTQNEVITDVNIVGNGGSTLTFEVPDEKEEKRPHATITISPGRTSVMSDPVVVNDVRDDGAPDRRTDIQDSRAQPINYPLLVAKWSPLLLGALVALGLLRRGRRASHHEVNFGIYKGAMPLELISHRYRKLVHTSRLTTENPFGKSRSDYVPAEWRRWEAEEVEAADDAPSRT